MYRLFFKSLVDFVLSFILIIIFSLLIVCIIIGLTFYNRGTPFFTQQRPGKKGQIFKLIKFKTMKDAWDFQGNPLPDKDRITPVGRWVRKLSLDELPQLFNVLKGDMSLIGPRPLLVNYLPLYNTTQNRRHEVKPGITGWAQVNGRNAIGWDKKFELDVWYVNHLSFRLDLKILFLTVRKVFIREGIDASINNTMKPFKGDSK